MRIVARLSRAVHTELARHIQSAAHRVPACVCRHARTRSYLTPHRLHTKQVSTAALAVEEEVREHAFSKRTTRRSESRRMLCSAEYDNTIAAVAGRGLWLCRWVPSTLNAGCIRRQRLWRRVLVTPHRALQRQSGTRAALRSPPCLPRPPARASTGPCRYWTTAATRCGTQTSHAACGRAFCACERRVGHAVQAASSLWLHPGGGSEACVLPAQGTMGGSLAGLCVT